MTQAQYNEDKTPDKQSIEQLQQRYQGLQTRKIQAETQRDSAQERLQELKEQAVEKYGTSDVVELKSKLEQMKTENEKKRAKYQTDLDKVDQALGEVEKKFAPPVAPDDEVQE